MSDGNLIRSSSAAFFLPSFLGVLTCASSAVAGFTDVTSQVGLLPQLKKSWGNPIWGDINNDGYLDFIVPTHGLSKSGGPMVYLNNRGTSFYRHPCYLRHR